MFSLYWKNHTASQENEGGVIVYLSNKARIQRLGRTLRVANRGPISKVIKNQTITAIIPLDHRVAHMNHGNIATVLYSTIG